MNITGIRDDGYRLLDINPGTTVSDYVRADLSNALNAALQTLSLAGPEYFLAEEMTQSIVAGAAEYPLASAIQRITGPVTLSGVGVLRELRNQTQYAEFSSLFGVASPGTPIAYFINASRGTVQHVPDGEYGDIVVTGAGTSAANGTYQHITFFLGLPLFCKAGTDPYVSSIVWSGSDWHIFGSAGNSLYRSASNVDRPDAATGWVAMDGTLPPPTLTYQYQMPAMATITPSPDSVAMTLCLAPTPNANGTLAWNAIREPTSYTAANMDNAGTTIPVAHQYVETLLLPIFRWFLTRSRYFSAADKLPMLEADYKLALGAIGLGEPTQNPTRRTSPTMEEAA